MTDEQLRYYARTRHERRRLITLYHCNRDSHPQIYIVLWLQVMGLMETAYISGRTK